MTTKTPSLERSAAYTAMKSPLVGYITLLNYESILHTEEAKGREGKAVTRTFTELIKPFFLYVIPPVQLKDLSDSQILHHSERKTVERETERQRQNQGSCSLEGKPL